MAEFYGVTGKILRIDVSKETSQVIESGEDVYKKYVGGIGLAMYHLYKEGVVSPEVKPFDPQNIVHIMGGPLNGACPGTQTVAVTKSPYNFICISYSGGHATGEIKFAGWDGIQVVGKAKDLIWVSVVDDKVEFHDAKDLKGKDTEETEFIIKGQVWSPLEYRKERILTKENLPVGKDAKGNSISMWDWWGVRSNPQYAIGEKRMAKVWTIGPGGEKGVWYACIVTEGSDAHGRYGSGAVLGSKNVKAIAIRGTKGQKFYDKTKALQLIKNVINTGLTTQLRWRTYGTGSSSITTHNYEDAYGIRNWQYLAWHDARSLTGMSGSFLEVGSWIKAKTCCTIGCQICMHTAKVTSDDPEMDGTVTDMPDWEAVGNVGGLLDLVITEDQFPGKTPEEAYLADFWDKVEASDRLHYVTNMFDKLGLDYIEGGDHIGMLMELRQRNLITKEDLLLPSEVGDLVWGNYKAAAWVLKQMCTSDAEVYQALRKGTYETAKYFAQKKNNPNIMYYSQTIKRYGQPAHDPRGGRCKKPDEFLHTERPAAHTEGYDSVVPLRAALGSLVACNFALSALGGNQGIAALVEAFTGWKFAEEDLVTLGERVWLLERTFNIVTQEITNPAEQWDNLWPRRWLEPIPTGPLAGQPSKVTEAVVKEGLSKYYANRGLDEKGFPKAETLAKYGIEFADQYLKKYRGY